MTMATSADRIKERAHGQWIDLLVDVGGLPLESLDGRHHPCPLCGGKDRFRLIDINEGAVLCSQCFHEKNGDGIAAIGWARNWTFKQTIDALADKLGVQKRDQGKKKRHPADELEWRDWSAERVDLWGQNRKLGHQTVEANGGRIARWRHRTTVVALPVQRLRFVVDEKNDGEVKTRRRTVGWTIYNINGKALERRDGTPAKVLLTTGSQAGWLGTWALDRIQTAKVVWKVEGPTDMLALWQAIPADWRDSHVVLSNANGSTENPRPELIGILTGKRVIVVHDADDPGRKGAEKWARGIAQVPGTRVSIVDLPDDGTDLRDWLNAGNTYKDLVQLAKDTARDVEAVPVANGRAKPVTPTSGGEHPPDGLPNEAMDDPARLAKEFIRSKIGNVAYYQSKMHYWFDGCWSEVSEANLRSDITIFISREFTRINLELLELAKKSDAPPPQVHKTYNSIVSSTMACVQAFCTVRDSIEWGRLIERNNENGIIITEDKGVHQWISCANGIMKLEDMMQGENDVLAPHTPDWWSPHRLAFPFDPEAGADKCPLWMSFLERAMEGDQERIDTLQEWAGYLLVPDTSMQRFLILYGDGSNGKSVYCSVIGALLGKRNVSSVTLERFHDRFQLTSTLGCLANIVTEIGDVDKVAEGIMKQFVVGDPMTFDRKNLPPIHAEPTARLVFATNNLPRINDRTDGVWRRMSLVPWNNVIPEEDRVYGMDKAPWWEARGELPAILNWAIEGLVRLYISRQFTESNAERTAKEEFKMECNPAREFLKTSVDIAPANTCSVNALYKAYKEWCGDHNHRPLGSRLFGKEVKRVFPDVLRKRMGGRENRDYFYEGISIKTYGELDYS